jgi:hypothetical protein
MWKEAKKNINFNAEGFNFIGIEGTYVERKEIQGAQFPILLYFQGENCIEDAAAFEQSARDKRPWVIKHPFYDDLTVQPLELSVDNTDMNVVKITGILWETITAKYPENKVDPVKAVEVNKTTLDDGVADTFTNDIGTPAATSITPARASINSIYGNYQTIAQQSTDIQNLTNALRTASSAASELISAPERFIRQVIDLINLPFTIVQDIRHRIDSLLDTFNDLLDIFVRDDSSEEDFIQFKAQATVLLSETALVVMSSKESDYLTRANVLTVASRISASYNEYINALDENEITENQQISRELDYIMNVAFGYLFDIVFSAKQERTYILEEDNNIITLAHRFLGPGDENIELFIAQNNITLDEYLGLMKGRKIIYYI